MSFFTNYYETDFHFIYDAEYFFGKCHEKIVIRIVPITILYHATYPYCKPRAMQQKIH